MKLIESDIRTRQVLSWKGLHLFHAHSSSCSQKVRIFLNLKGVEWQSHPLNFNTGENLSDFYLGINPRGLVPTIVHDGDVHIESNDILTYLEEVFPNPALIPSNHRDEVAVLLRHEDDLHLALRTASFRFLFAPEKPPKSAEDLARYAQFSSGTVGGIKDDQIDEQIAYWRNVLDSGISDAAARQAVDDFRVAFTDLDRQLSRQQFIMGDQLSVLDIAWVVYVNRMELAGYPVARLHPDLGRWANELKRHPAFVDELALPKPLAEMTKARQQALAAEGRDLATLCSRL
jgi:glutathione S-transferase